MTGAFGWLARQVIFDQQQQHCYLLSGVRVMIFPWLRTRANSFMEVKSNTNCNLLFEPSVSETKENGPTLFCNNGID